MRKRTPQATYPQALSLRTGQGTAWRMLELCVRGRPEVLVRVVDEHERVAAELVLGLVQSEAVAQLGEDAVVRAALGELRELRAARRDVRPVQRGVLRGEARELGAARDHELDVAHDGAVVALHGVHALHRDVIGEPRPPHTSTTSRVSLKAVFSKVIPPGAQPSTYEKPRCTMRPRESTRMLPLCRSLSASMYCTSEWRCLSPQQTRRPQMAGRLRPRCPPSPVTGRSAAGSSTRARSAWTPG
eukprot:scaffold92031_cov72-Phaeocystis_antarctica.AAC.4